MEEVEEAPHEGDDEGGDDHEEEPVVVTDAERCASACSINLNEVRDRKWGKTGMNSYLSPLAGAAQAMHMIPKICKS